MNRIEIQKHNHEKYRKISYIEREQKQNWWKVNILFNLMRAKNYVLTHPIVSNKF